MPRAKLAKDAKFGDRFLFFAPFACFARDIPRLTGARSAPYEILRALRVLRGEKLFPIWLRRSRPRLFAVKSSPSSVQGRDESRPYFVTFVPFVVTLFSSLVAALPR